MGWIEMAWLRLGLAYILGLFRRGLYGFPARVVGTQICLGQIWPFLAALTQGKYSVGMQSVLERMSALSLLQRSLGDDQSTHKGLMMSTHWDHVNATYISTVVPISRWLSYESIPSTHQSVEAEGISSHLTRGCWKCMNENDH